MDRAVEEYQAEQSSSGAANASVSQLHAVVEETANESRSRIRL